MSGGLRTVYNPRHAFYHNLKRVTWRNNLKPTGDLVHCPDLPVSAEKDANLT
jgi:hypothetical protein